MTSMSRSPSVLRGAKQIAHELGVSVRTLHRQIKAGKVPVEKGGCGGKTSFLLLDRTALSSNSQKKD
ncbi:helix-turn-helix transcriptional regulator [Aquabacter cavernae]|uniref:helix-turn-helix transcriptional regulator n=1 Tax=Aquabacter cavernae TaxID=2496029 RepID=UPI000F8EB1E4|nr:hypothetical protein [Aquabacter cavernae]